MKMFLASAVFVAMLTRVVGGAARGPQGEHHPFARIAHLVPNMLNFATSARMFHQFWQMYKVFDSILFRVVLMNVCLSFSIESLKHLTMDLKAIELDMAL